MFGSSTFRLPIQQTTSKKRSTQSEPESYTQHTYANRFPTLEHRKHIADKLLAKAPRCPTLRKHSVFYVGQTESTAGRDRKIQQRGIVCCCWTYRSTACALTYLPWSRIVRRPSAGGRQHAPREALWEGGRSRGGETALQLMRQAMRWIRPLRR